MLCRIVGCEQRWTSATFLRAELGVPSARFLGDYRALTYYRHLTQETWFKDLLPHLAGDGPLQRIKGIAEKYQINLTEVAELSKGQWKTRVKNAIMNAAQEFTTKELATRGYPVQAEPAMVARPYIIIGGPTARFGVHWRWSLLRPLDDRFIDKRLPQHQAPAPCTACGTIHHNQENPDMKAMWHCSLLMPATHLEARNKAIKDVVKEFSGIDCEDGIPIGLGLRPHLKNAIEDLSWPNQTTLTTSTVMRVFARLVKMNSRRTRVVRARHKCLQRWKHLVGLLIEGDRLTA
jgi:hypothetical protein